MANNYSHIPCDFCIYQKNITDVDSPCKDCPAEGFSDDACENCKIDIPEVHDDSVR